MKNIKKLYLILATASATLTVPHDGSGWGGFAAGALTTAAVTGIMNSNKNQPPEYYEMQRDRQRNSEINRTIRQHERDIKTHRRNISQLNKNKNLSSDDRNKQITASQSKIQEHEKEIKDLRNQLF